MNRIWPRVVDALAGLLTAGEREVVLGDIAESGESGRAAMHDVLGLLARRQAQWWMADCLRWWPLISVAGLLAIRLSLYARNLSHEAAIYAWMYLDNWTPLYVDGAAWRHDLIQYTVVFALSALRIACFSAGLGVVIGFISRRAL